MIPLLVIRLLLFVAILGCSVTRTARGQEPAAADSARAAQVGGDSARPAEPVSDDSARAAQGAPRDSMRPSGGVGAADSTAAADSTVTADSIAAADSAAADSAEAAAADTLARVRSDIVRTRERLEEVEQALATFPEEDKLRRSPRGAVLRAFALPGWGQFYTGHTFRGFLYAGAELGFATLGIIRQRQVLDLRDDIFRAKLDFVAADQALNPDSVYSLEDSLALYDRFESSAGGFALLSELDNKQKSRENFFTYAIFSVLFSAIDAFVSAHLEPFDTTKLDVTPADGGWRLDVRVPLGRGSAGSTAAPAREGDAQEAPPAGLPP